MSQNSQIGDMAPNTLLAQIMTQFEQMRNVNNLLCAAIQVQSTKMIEIEGWLITAGFNPLLPAVDATESQSAGNEMSSDENETTQSKVNIKIEQDTSISSLAAKRRKINHIDALPKSYQKNKTLPEPSTSNADDRKGKSLKRKAPDTVICSDCKVTFKKADYARHLEESSCNSQVCNYPDCGKRFATIKRLRQHFALHNEEGFCSVCNTAYQPGDLNLHLSCRPIACTFAGCNRRFKLLSAFKSHFRSHTNAELLCPYENCKKTFKEDRFLKAHIISKHKNDTLPSTKRQSNVDFNQSQDLDDPMNLMELVCSQYED